MRAGYPYIIQTKLFGNENKANDRRCFTMISLPPADHKHIYRRCHWQPLQSGLCMLVLILPTPGGWKAEWTLEGKVTQIFKWEPQGWEVEILPLCQPLHYIDSTILVLSIHVDFLYTCKESFLCNINLVINPDSKTVLVICLDNLIISPSLPVFLKP